MAGSHQRLKRKKVKYRKREETLELIKRATTIKESEKKLNRLDQGTNKKKQRRDRIELQCHNGTSTFQPNRGGGDTHPLSKSRRGKKNQIWGVGIKVVG